MNNHRVLSRFVDHWSEFVKMSPTAQAVFLADVAYKSKTIDVEAQTKVLLTRGGYEDGKVSFAEKGALRSEYVHLDFSPDFQQYSLTSDKHLKISGTSSKMGGDYTVVVCPLQALTRADYP